jgi:hypothetical protein
MRNCLWGHIQSFTNEAHNYSSTPGPLGDPSWPENLRQEVNKHKRVLCPHSSAQPTDSLTRIRGPNGSSLSWISIPQWLEGKTLDYFFMLLYAPIHTPLSPPIPTMYSPWFIHMHPHIHSNTHVHLTPILQCCGLLFQLCLLLNVTSVRKASEAHRSSLWQFK